MRRRRSPPATPAGQRRWRMVAGLILAPVLAAGCGSAPVAPLPGQWPTPTPPATATGSRTSTVPSRPAGTPATSAAVSPPAGTPRRTRTRTRTRTPPRTSPTVELSPACLPAVIYTVDGSDPAAMPEALCLTVAAILRIQNVWPEAVTATPPEQVARHWEAGVLDCRMLRPGTVTVEIASETGGSHTITVLVVE
ncbi:hypothetical protein [Plantactinospora sp. KLBMP9567]|uniref:hypothetical protein n=1 Tax=Plantactinospora sp. KLBMP9567 TaxID=3085900 RepID=UPI002980FF61|nr:hypothetical protein [Plantactinospora sp. KLBMP9567]MDW5326523.1 hypothetical protein [Plantactinospora sp. KLBMP9567]